MILSKAWNKRNRSMKFVWESRAPVRARFLNAVNARYLRVVEENFYPKRDGDRLWYNIDWQTGEVKGHKTFPIPPCEVGL